MKHPSITRHSGSSPLLEGISDKLAINMIPLAEAGLLLRRTGTRGRRLAPAVPGNSPSVPGDDVTAAQHTPRRAR